MTIAELLVYGAATWRIASMFVRERGPFDVFVWIRERAGIVHDDEKAPIGYPDTFFGGLLSCVWCSSMWVAVFLGILILLVPAWSLTIAMVFAFSTIAAMIDSWIKKTG